jgi:hypothetical protein
MKVRFAPLAIGRKWLRGRLEHHTTDPFRDALQRKRAFSETPLGLGSGSARLTADMAVRTRPIFARTLQGSWNGAAIAPPRGSRSGLR